MASTRERIGVSLSNPRKAARLALLRLLPPNERMRLALHILGAVEPELALRFDRRGTHWTLPLGDEIVESVLRQGHYEGDELGGLLKWLESNTTRTKLPVVVDVGANTGTTSIPLAQGGFRVLALEPVPRTFDYLCKNVRDNDLSREITAVQTAISLAGPTVEMVLGGGLGLSEVRSSSKQTKLSDARNPIGSSVSVPAAGLCEVLTEHEVQEHDVAFVWCDTQGSEAAVIASGAALWATGTPLYTELWPAALAARTGMASFFGLVETTFTHFVARDSLVDLGATAVAQPIEELKSLFDGGRPDNYYTDALLLPPDWKR